MCRLSAEDMQTAGWTLQGSSTYIQVFDRIGDSDGASASDQASDLAKVLYRCCHSVSHL